MLRHLIETDSIKPDVLKFDASGKNIGIKASNGKIKEVVEGGLPFIIGGCSCKDGDIACNRPFGSYRPGEPFRDFPFYPEPNDITKITKELCLKSLVSY